MGVARSDMAGLFWGSSFLLVLAYAVVADHVTCATASRGRRSPGFLRLHLPTSVAKPGESAEGSLSVTLPRTFLPGYVVRFRLPLAWLDRRIDGFRAQLAPGNNAVTVRFTAGQRGQFSASRAAFEVRDILGFTSRSFFVPVAESIRVFPRLARAESIRVTEDGGEAARYATRRRRSDELLEVRKYYPGDDVRKLNWKVFAHVRELLIRVGEETPPPQSRFLFLLDSTANPLVPETLRGEYLDAVVESCASTVAAVLDGGTEALFMWPGRRAAKAFTQESLTDLLGVLAGVAWEEPGWRPELPFRAGLHAVLFSTPGSPALPGLVTELRGRGWKVSLLLKDMEVARTRLRPRLRDLIFIAEGGRKDRAGATSPKQLKEFRDARDAAMSRYGALLVGGAAP